MIDMIFLFMFSIVLVIVVMSTVNTMSMAVLERTREIGTLRALGLKRRGVSMLFAMEGGMLGLLGSLIGVVLHTCVWAIIRAMDPTYTPPGISTPVPLIVGFVPQTLVLLAICLIILSLIAAIIPARRAARAEHRKRPGARVKGRQSSPRNVIPARTGMQTSSRRIPDQVRAWRRGPAKHWTPAFAGVTTKR